MGNTKESRDKYNAMRKARRAAARTASLNPSKKLGQTIAEHESRNKTAALEVLSEKKEKLIEGKASEIIDDLRALQEAEPDRFITRQFYRNNGAYADSAWVSRFGTFEELKRCAAINTSRGVHKIELNIATHAARDRYRGFQEVELDPYVGKYDKPDTIPGYKRIVIASDFHGQNADPFVLEVLLDTIRRTQPNAICLAGDVFDMYDFSRFDRDPRQSDLKGEFDFVKREILGRIRKAAGSKCLIDFVLGNHESRLLRHLADKTPYMKMLLDLMGHTMSSLMGLDEYKINLVSRYDLAAHQPREMREEMKNNYKTYYNCLTIDHGDSKNNRFKLCRVSGHTHKPALVTDTHEIYGDIWNMTLGSLAKVDLEYVDGLNRYQNGFGIVHINTETKACVAENIVFANEMVVVGGKVYTR